MDDKIMVSIICTAYNHSEYIENALKGFVMQQTNFPFEVIINDDASTDDTAQLIASYQKKYPKIIKPIYQTENQYSKGVEIWMDIIYPNLTGKYIAFCEGDDYWTDPLKLQRQVDFLEDHPDYSACGHETEMYNCRTHTSVPVNGATEDYDIPLETFLQGGEGGMHTSSIVARKQILDEMIENTPEFFFFQKSVSDYPLKVYLAWKGKVRFLAKEMSLYRSFAVGSWTSGHASVEHMVHSMRASIRLVESFDALTDGVYHDIALRVTQRQKLHILNLEGHYAEMLAPEYRQAFACLTPKHRVKTYLKAKCDWLYRAYRKYKA